MKCRTVSGWSDWSNWFFAKTLAFQPESPLPLEIRKVSVNGVMLTWFKPKRDNGHAIDHYQIEVADSHTIETGQLNKDHLYADTADPDDEDEMDAKQLEQKQKEEREKQKRENRNSSLRTLYNLMEGDDNNAADASLFPDDEDEFLAAKGKLKTKAEKMNEELEKLNRPKKKFSLAKSQGGISKLYRLVKHKQLDLLMKYITGLEPQRQYKARVRAHNKVSQASRLPQTTA